MRAVRPLRSTLYGAPLQGNHVTFQRGGEREKGGGRRRKTVGRVKRNRVRKGYLKMDFLAKEHMRGER